MNECRKPIRILHVLGMMERGGAETWLMHLLRMVDHDRYRMDFLVHLPEPQDYDDEIRALGSAVIVCPYTRQPLRYAQEFLRVLREHGPYDVVHSHVHHYSGLVLRLAKRAGVPIRIAHSHLDDSAAEAKAGMPRRAYLRLMRRLMAASATDGLAASAQAAADLFGPAWDRDSRYRTLFCGINFDPFAAPVCPHEVRTELGVPDGALVVGHVGRFTEQKNHAFFLDIAAAIVRREPTARFLLVGEGELRPEMQARAAAMDLADHVVFAGARPDVPRLMRGAMDVFLFPSRYEGLGLVLVEGQAAGLPCVFSDVIPSEADIAPPLVHRRALDDSAEMWAETVLTARRHPLPLAQPDALRIARNSPFDVRRSWQELEPIYARR